MRQPASGAGPRIYLLGHFEVRLGDELIIDSSWSRGKAAALLKLLAVQKDRALHREQVFDTLWPQLDPSAAANNLRKNLHYLRSEFSGHGDGNSLLAAKREILELSPDVWLDIDAFSHEAAAARKARSNPSTYERALALYAGDLLPEDIYADWTRPRREALRSLYNDLLAEIGDLYEADGQAIAAEDRLRELLAADPLREDAHRSLMRILARVGKRERSLRQYRSCRDVLKRELGIDLSVETEALYKDILDGNVAASKLAPTREAIPLATEPQHADLPTSTQVRSAPATILFTNVVSSMELLRREGAESAQRVVEAHHRLLRQAIVENDGREAKWQGDHVMATFHSVADAVRSAIAMQLSTQRPLVGERLQIRVGLNTGQVLEEDGDYFGTPVVVARRLCDRAQGGQILCSSVVAGLLFGRQAFKFRDCGPLELKGIAEAVPTSEVMYEPEEAGALLRQTPLVGRTEEISKVNQALDQAREGSGGLVMIAGEPGTGKTRLASELAAGAHQRGMLALTGRCYEIEGSAPYIPFVEIVEASAKVVPAESLREALGDSAPEVAKLIPDLRRLFPDIPAPPELPPEQGRRYLFNGIRDFLTRTGQQQPLFLVLEDLQWADDSTLLLLQHIAQGLHDAPILILGTYRDVEVDAGGPLARTLEELARQRLSEPIALERLPQGDVVAMMRAISGHEPPQPLVDVVYGATEGNPFFVEEVIHHLAEEGKLFDTQGSWLPDLELSEIEVPEGVRLVIWRRLERVGEDCRRALISAAIIGRRFSFELLEALGDADADTLLDAMDEAERAHLITSTDDESEDRLAFGHELIRQTLLAGVSAPRRQRLHLRVAGAIEQLYAANVEEHAADLAHHLSQAGSAADLLKTVKYLTLAGDQALSAAAFERALHLFENAFSRQAAHEGPGRIDLLFKRGLALRSLGRWDEALRDWREALDAYEELGDAEAVGRISSEITVQLLWDGRFVEALEVSRRGIIALGERLSADRCRLLATAGLTLSAAGSYAAGDGMITQSVGLAQKLGDERLHGWGLDAKTAHHWVYTQLQEAVDAGLEAAALLRSAGDLWALAHALWPPQQALVWLCRLDEAAKIGEELEPLAARLGHVGALLAAGRSRGWRELMLTPELDRFEAFAKSDLELCRSADVPWISNSYRYLGLADFWRGRWDEARKNFQEAASLEQGSLGGGDWGFLFLFKAYCGDKDEALAMLQQKMGDLPRSGQPNTNGAWIRLLTVVEGLALLSERESAAGLYSLVIEAIDTGAVVCPLGEKFLQTVAGIAAACGGQWQMAEKHYRTALRQAHELPHKMEQPEVRRFYARMLIDRGGQGDRDKAQELLTEAIDMYGQIGMPKHAEMAEDMMAEA
ncbi:MAG: AAA family ATPase [Chloroflexi bacterium]|nr:AAA family ATPase [Chloroflexota bacterium]